jgi:hypothetical protein
MSMGEVDAPSLGICASGHSAPAVFRREGPDSLEEPTRFFQVSRRDSISGKMISLGVYCEPCLIIANAIARSRRASGNAKC